MLHDAERRLAVADSIDMALAARRGGAVVLAGGTWMMRDPRRGISLPTNVVVLSAIPALTDVTIEHARILIGASVTHAALANSLRGVEGMAGIVAAAEGAANPAIRRVATVGGNLCTPDFPAADLVPAFLAHGAPVELASPEGMLLIGMSDFVRQRRDLLHSAILTRLHLQRDIAASAHARLPLRKAGDYPVAIVSVAVQRDGAVRVAVGSVETEVRRWTALEHALAAEAGAIRQPDRAADLARKHMDFTGRDGIEADGWYRCQVLPALLRRAVVALAMEEAWA